MKLFLILLIAALCAQAGFAKSSDSKKKVSKYDHKQTWPPATAAPGYSYTANTRMIVTGVSVTAPNVNAESMVRNDDVCSYFVHYRIVLV